MIPECSCDEREWHEFPSGGRWRCRERKRASDRAHLLTDKGRARRRRFHLATGTRARTRRINHYEELRNSQVHREVRS